MVTWCHATLILAVLPLAAEQGILVVHVRDLHDRPVAGLRLRAGDSSVSAPTTDSYGETRIRLAPQTQEGDVVVLEIVAAPEDLVFISPWDKWVHVPPFGNESKNIVSVVLAKRGDRACLEDYACIRAATAQINKASAPKRARERVGEEQRRGALTAVAKSFGLEPREIDLAIRAWGQKTQDPYEKGLAALFEKRYPEASRKLAESFEMHKAAEAGERAKAANAATFLGQSLSEEREYRQSAEAYEEAASRRPDDPAVLNSLGLAWWQAGEWSKAEPPLRRALAIQERASGPDDQEVAWRLVNLAALLFTKSNHAEAEALYRRALSIQENAVGQHDVHVTPMLSGLALVLIAKGDRAGAEALYRREMVIVEGLPQNGTTTQMAFLFQQDSEILAGLLAAKGDYGGAEPLYRRALPVREKMLGPDDPYVVCLLNGLAGVLYAKGDYTGAEPLYRRALAIAEKRPRPYELDVATALDNLAGLLYATKDYAGAAPLYERALAIREKVLGADSPSVVQSLNNMAGLLYAQRDYWDAEPLYRRAVAIEAKAAGQDHPDLATALNNLAGLLFARGDSAAAEPLYRSALAVQEKALGPSHLEVAKSLNSLAWLLQARGDCAGAEPLLGRALAIDEQALGPDHPTTGLARSRLDALRAMCGGQNKSGN